MPYLPDLTRYDYLPQTVPADVRAVAVGWLDRDHDFTRGEVSDAFLDALLVACRDRRSALTRGCQVCPFCGRTDPDHLCLTATRGDIAALLGNGEVRVLGADPLTWLVAPTLVFHYVEVHRYRPPDEFIEAVVAGHFVAHPDPTMQP